MPAGMLDEALAAKKISVLLGVMGLGVAVLLMGRGLRLLGTAAYRLVELLLFISGE